MANVDPGEHSAGNGEPGESDPKSDPPPLNKVLGIVFGAIAVVVAIAAGVANTEASGHVRATLETTAAICLVGAVSVVLYVYRDRKVPAGAVTAAAVIFLALGTGIGHFGWPRSAASHIEADGTPSSSARYRAWRRC